MSAQYRRVVVAAARVQVTAGHVRHSPALRPVTRGEMP